MMQHTAAGKIKLFIGPMFSGKTTTMLTAVERMAIAGHKCVVIKYIKDVRYSDRPVVRSHSGKTFTEDIDSIRVVSAECLADVALDEYETVVGIDEGQFYADIVEVCTRWADTGKLIFVAALDGNFMRIPMGKIPELISVSDKVTKLNAICMGCGRPAPFSSRIAAAPLVGDILIGGKDKYKTLCRRCWNNDNAGHI